MRCPERAAHDLLNRARRVRAASRAPRRTARGGGCRRCVRRAVDVGGAACGANDEAIDVCECDGDGFV